MNQPPYHVETFPIGSCVCDEQGFNCLSFDDKPGAKFTTLEVATEICERWNTVSVTLSQPVELLSLRGAA